MIRYGYVGPLAPWPWPWRHTTVGFIGSSCTGYSTARWLPGVGPVAQANMAKAYRDQLLFWIERSWTVMTNIPLFWGKVIQCMLGKAYKLQMNSHERGVGGRWFISLATPPQHGTWDFGGLDSRARHWNKPGERFQAESEVHHNVS